MSNFNGQINISRDLRQNKQTILGKRDLTDLVFIIIGISIAVMLGYLLGFYLKALDEFTAVVIALIPMVIILTFGFRRKAGIRWIYYILASVYEKKCKNRSNKETLINVIRINKKTINNEKSKTINKDINLLKKVKALTDIIKKGKHENKRIVKLDYINNKENTKNVNNKIIIDKAIFVFETDSDIKQLALNYIENSDIEKIQVRLKSNNKKLLLLENISYKKFLNDYTKREIKNIGKSEKLLRKIKAKIEYIINEKKKYHGKFSKFLNLSKFNLDYFDEKAKDLLNDFNSKNLKFIDINDEFVNNLNVKDKKVYMLHLYRNDTYEIFINELKEVSEVVINFTKHQDKYYVSTFIIFDGSEDKIHEIINKYDAIVNKLTNEQGTAKPQVGYYMANPFNSYREYRV